MHAPARVDLHGRVAELAVERSLRGDAVPEARLRIAWEELASDSPGRFHEGNRILVALEPLPELSLWRERFPEGGALAVAGRGAGFLRDPDAASVDLLAAYLALEPEARGGDAGARALSAIAAGAEPALAGGALARLGSLELDPAVVEVLARVLGDQTRPLALRRAVLALAGERRVAALRPGIQAMAAAPGPLAADAVEALARLDGSLPEARLRELLASRDPALRAAAVRQSGGQLGVAELGELVRADAAADVRAAALGALVARGGEEALERASAGLFDADPSVRREAVTRLGARGAEAVPVCLRLAFARSSPEAAAPVAALALAGPSGLAALGELASRHPDPKVRKLALLALGRPLPEH